MDEISARLACQQLTLPNSALVSALNHFGSAVALLAAKQEFLAPFFRAKDIAKIENWQSWSVQEQHISFAIRKIEALEVAVLSIVDEEYPQLLREIPDPPALLHVKGDLAKLKLPQIAVVGSRKMTPIGGRIAQEFAHHLGAAGIAITSGLALGIDTCAHAGALQANATTIAVLGTGIDGRYPRSNEALYDQILTTGGLLVSEYPLGTPPRPGNFPKRNRIITGLSMATLVVEASEKSGSLVSARLAAEQGRQVFAVPGNTRSAASMGCHQLIREGATLVTEPRQILEDIGPMFGLTVAEQQSASSSENAPALESTGTDSHLNQHWLIEALGFDCLTIDEICDRSNKPAQEVTAAITQFEISGAIVASSQGYQRVS